MTPQTGGVAIDCHAAERSSASWRVALTARPHQFETTPVTRAATANVRVCAGKRSRHNPTARQRQVRVGETIVGPGDVRPLRSSTLQRLAPAPGLPAQRISTGPGVGS